MDDEQLRDELHFAMIKAEQLSVLDVHAANPMDIASLVDVLQVFGFSPDDLVDHHDQCTIFHTIRTELRTLLSQLAMQPTKYDQAIVLRDRLRVIKREFIAMQEMYEQRRQDKEAEHFRRGLVLTKQRNDALYARRTHLNEQAIEKHKHELQKTQQVERTQLDRYLRNLQAPRVKYSKQLLELKNTEKNLAKLKLFEEAKTVSIRLNRMEKAERTLNVGLFDNFKETKRAVLVQKHEEELAEAEEKVIEKRYVVTRANDDHRKTEVQRMKNLKKDMQQMHAMDLHRKRVFSTNGVAGERKAYGATSSSFRGQQLLGTVQGKRLEIASLCLLHDNENGVVPPDAVILD